MRMPKNLMSARELFERSLKCSNSTTKARFFQDALDKLNDYQDTYHPLNSQQKEMIGRLRLIYTRTILEQLKTLSTVSLHSLSIWAYLLTEERKPELKQLGITHEKICALLADQIYKVINLK